mgnify:CR=1 FL=1
MIQDRKSKKGALAGLILAAAVLGERVPDPAGGALFGTGGALAGLGVTGIAMDVIWRRMSQEQRREMERGERDERNVAIREKAAYASWYWTLYLLWVPFVISLVRGETLWILLSSAVTVLHCVFYMVNMGRWAKKL